MVGSTLDGRWNETEAVSLMFKTGDTLHALPALPEVSNYIRTGNRIATEFIMMFYRPRPGSPSTPLSTSYLNSPRYRLGLAALRKFGMVRLANFLLEHI